MAGTAEVAAMRRAITLAARGAGRTNPNPAVGAVVLDAGGAVVGEGWHQRAGEAHAEVRALAAAGEAARSGTLVVTLEPCRHRGRTQPCTAAILAAGVSRVVVAGTDPHPHAGGGAQELTAAGVDVELGVLAEPAERVNEAWLGAVRLGRSFVTFKYAATLDGRTAAADRTSRWITGEAARVDAHRWRAESDAVAVGIGTVLADDPRLTVRAFDWPRHPVRVVVDSRGRLPLDAAVLQPGPATLVAVGAAEPERVKALRSRATEVLELPDADGRVDLAALLVALQERALPTLLVEGGARLAGALAAAGRLDRVVGYLAPLLLGSGVPVLDGAFAPTLAAARRLRVDDVRMLGGDVRVVARCDRRAG